MELIEGRTLDQLIAATGVSLAQFFIVTIAIAEALAAAHQKQITHRDLKPGNVMVMESGLVKVLDFGLARGAASDNLAEQVTLLTQAGTVLGAARTCRRAGRGAADRSAVGHLLVRHRDVRDGRGIAAIHGRYARVTDAFDRQGSSARSLGDPARCFRGDYAVDWALSRRKSGDRVQTTQETLIELKAHRRAWESGVSSKPRLSSARMAASDESRFRIAVLPFQSRTAGSDAEALADGLTDDITAGLARFPYLRVVSGPDAEAAKGKAGTPGRQRWSAHGICSKAPCGRRAP